MKYISTKALRRDCTNTIEMTLEIGLADVFFNFSITFYSTPTGSVG